MSEEIKKDLSDAEVTEEVLEEETLKETSSGEDVMEGETKIGRASCRERV